MNSTHSKKRSKTEKKSKSTKKAKVGEPRSQLKRESVDFCSSLKKSANSSPPSSSTLTLSSSISHDALNNETPVFDSNDYREFLKFKSFQESQRQQTASSSSNLLSSGKKQSAFQNCNLNDFFIFVGSLSSSPLLTTTTENSIFCCCIILAEN